jgi:light-harvesting complex 1 beta chain
MSEKGLFAQSGLTEAEAKELHGYFTTWFGVYLAFAILAHALMFAWRPWIRPAERAMLEGAEVMSSVANILT